MADGVYKFALSGGEGVAFYNPDCPCCRDWPDHMRPSCAVCQPELMAAWDATEADVEEAAAKAEDPAEFRRTWSADARMRVAVGTVVRYRRHTLRPSRPCPPAAGGACG